MTTSVRFRVTSIALDEQENVAAVTARAGSATLRVIAEFIDGLSWQVIDERESEIVLPLPGLLKLFHDCGGLNGLDPRHDHTHRIYDSLSMVVYGLIETE